VFSGAARDSLKARCRAGASCQAPAVHQNPISSAGHESFSALAIRHIKGDSAQVVAAARISPACACKDRPHAAALFPSFASKHRGLFRHSNCGKPSRSSLGIIPSGLRVLSRYYPSKPTRLILDQGCLLPYSGLPLLCSRSCLSRQQFLLASRENSDRGLSDSPMPLHLNMVHGKKSMTYPCSCASREDSHCGLVTRKRREAH
jgi:hypothetical protein